ncbi:MAG TPA: hypothetical protein VG389_00915 [Myxococcota bacterium]|jgi:hypothetical protein|nr:hypothetical protein [Myxococcota bacterium]
MAKGDNRVGPKMRRRKRQAKKKIRLRRRKEAGKSRKSAVRK